MGKCHLCIWHALQFASVGAGALTVLGAVLIRWWSLTGLLASLLLGGAVSSAFLIISFLKTSAEGTGPQKITGVAAA